MLLDYMYQSTFSRASCRAIRWSNKGLGAEFYRLNVTATSVFSLKKSNPLSTLSSKFTNKEPDIIRMQQEINCTFVVSPPSIPTVKVDRQRCIDRNDADAVFPVHRIYCVAKNYVDHVKEMGDDPIRQTPCFFTKPPDAVVNCANENNDNICEIPYPMKTSNLHYEIELVIAIGKSGKEIQINDAISYVYGYAVGCDLTRRDLQTIAKDSGRPWDSSKAFDRSAPIGYIYPITDNVTTISFDSNEQTNIWLDVNNQKRQNSTIQKMIWNVPEIISILSHEFELQPGDLIYTGTPAGVGAIKKGDVVKGGIDGIGSLSFRIT